MNESDLLQFTYDVIYLLKQRAGQFANLENMINQQTGFIRRNAGYQARQEIEKIKKFCGADVKRLEQFGFKVYSQNDEDGLISEIFRRIGIKKGLFCEIGVEDGLECNTLFLIHKGWKGLWLEGNSFQEEKIRSKFSSILSSKKLSLEIAKITPGNFNQIVKNNFMSVGFNIHDIDFLSIDIDGMDIYLMEALEFKPKVICIEYNAKFPPPINKKPVFNADFIWQGTDYMGSSLNSIADSANELGYQLVGTNLTGANAFFVRDDLVKDYFVENKTTEYLYNPPRYYLTVDHFMSDVGHISDFGPYIDLE